MAAVLRRRAFAGWLPAVTVAGLWPARAVAVAVDLGARLQAIESRAQGRLGVCIVDTGSGASVTHRADERFLMCSTFKLMASALVLQRVDQGKDRLDRVLPFGQGDLVPYSPVTSKHVDQGGMALGALCAATITTSDNTAANLILDSYGGPAALTAYLRALGDGVTRLDRYEPEVNRWQAGDARDTTSPRAMLDNMHRVLLGGALPSAKSPVHSPAVSPALSPASTQQLQAWLKANTTGDTRLRAGLPAGWTVGDKTGKSDPGNNNDIAIVWPPGGAPPLLVAVYLSESRAPDAVQDRCIADVGALLPLLAVR